MQATEYHEPHAESSTAQQVHDVHSEDGEETGEVHDAEADAVDEGGDGGDGDGDGDEGDHSAPVKKKRIIKSRQSLAEKTTGTTIFPISRVKRIIKADKELDMMSAEATFLVAVSTEYFIKHFMEEGFTKARIDRRRIVNYRDMANVVARSAEFDFLRDVVPLPIPMSEALAQRKAKAAADDAVHADPRPRAAPVAADSVDLSRAPEDLPPLAPSTNPLFPNAVVKRPPNTHARGPLGGPKTAVPAPLPSPATKTTGKHAPSTAQGLTTRGSARRSLNSQDAAEAREAIQGMEVDEY